MMSHTISLRGLPRARETPLTDEELLRQPLKVRDFVGELRAEILALNAQLDRLTQFEAKVRAADRIPVVSASADAMRQAIKSLDRQQEAA
jgi:hypothetical protein